MCADRLRQHLQQAGVVPRKTLRGERKPAASAGALGSRRMAGRRGREVTAGVASSKKEVICVRLYERAALDSSTGLIAARTRLRPSQATRLRRAFFFSRVTSGASKPGRKFAMIPEAFIGANRYHARAQMVFYFA